MTSTGNSQAATWKVTSQIDTPQVNQAGRPEQGKLIYFTTGIGNSGSVWVPNSKYTDQTYVKSAIQDAANHTDWVSTLTSES